MKPRLAHLCVVCFAFSLGAAFADAKKAPAATEETKSLGSLTAKNGFRNEKEIVEKFKAWRMDADAQTWLGVLGYDLKKIQSVDGNTLHGHKADIQIKVTPTGATEPELRNIQIKLVSSERGFNQIDKRWVKTYAEMWTIPADIVAILEHYTGEKPPFCATPRDARRMYLDEFPAAQQTALVNWITKNKKRILSDILHGEGEFAADWTMVAQKTEKNARWILKPMDYCIQHYGEGGVEITKQGNLKFGHVSMQRKGGDGGAESSNMLQFKVNPAELFEPVVVKK